MIERLMPLIKNKIPIYLYTAIISFLFAFLGFAYNTWRLEVTEANSNIRVAAFTVLNELSQLEQNIYASHYDQNPIEGSPRKGWVKIGLIVDLSVLISSDVEREAKILHQLWGESWSSVANDGETVASLVLQIDKVKMEIKHTLSALS